MNAQAILGLLGDVYASAQHAGNQAEELRNQAEELRKEIRIRDEQIMQLQNLIESDKTEKGVSNG